MEVKQQGERIKRSYQVISVFPFIHGVLYYTLYDSFDPEETPTRFIHAIEVDPLPNEDIISRLPLRNEDMFVPLQEVFVENSILYQVFEKMEGNLLGIYLHQNAPLALGEVSQIIQLITKHLIDAESQGQFALIDPQNMVVEADGRVRFLYGGPRAVLPNDLSGETDVVKQIGELLFLMLTGEKLENHVNELRPLRSRRFDVPLELEAWIIKSASPDPSKRPILQELRDWSHAHGGKKPEKIEEESFVNPSLDQFGVEKKAESISNKSGKAQKKKLPAWVTWAALGVLAIIYLLKTFFFSGPDASALIDAGIIKEVDQNQSQAAADYNKSVQSYQSGNLNQAISLAKQALSSDISNEQYYIQLANLYGLNQDYKSGQTVLLTAADNFSSDARLYDQLAVFDYYLRDYSDAKDAVDKALELNNNLASIYYHRGKIYFQLKDNNTALSSMKTAVTKDPKNAVYFHDFALIELQTGNVDDAVLNEQKAVQLSNKIEYRMSLGLLYLKQRDQLLKNQSLRLEVKKTRLKALLNDAYDQFDTINSMDDSNAEAYYYKARTYYINGAENPRSYQDAIIASQKAIHRDSNNALYYYQLGVCYMAVNNKAQAVGAFQQAVSHDPSNRLYQNGLQNAQAMK